MADLAPAAAWIAIGLPLLALLGRCCGVGRPALLLALALVPLGWALERRDAAAWRARSHGLLPHDGVAREMHFIGSLAEPVERDAEGERLLRLDGAPQGSASTASLRLRVRASPSEPTAELDRLETGEVVRVWCRVRRPHGLRNPGSEDPRRSLRGRGLDAVGSIKSARLVERSAQGSGGPRRWAGRARRFARVRLDRALGEEGPTRALAGAMLLGDRAGLSPELFSRLRRAGLAHLVAISGLHVGLLLGMAHELLRRAGAGPGARLCVLTLLLCGFVLLVGARSPVQRAALGGAAVLVGRSLGREGDGLNGLALLAAGLAALEPASIGDPGFQLTFLATAGILLGARELASRLPGPRLLAASFAVSGSAYLATAPVVATHFAFLAPVGLLSNLAAVPLCGLILLGGYGTILLSSWPLAGPLAEWTLGRATEALLALADAAGAIDGGAFHVPPPGPGLLVAYYALLLLGVVSRPRTTSARWAGGAFGLALIWIHLGPAPAPAGGGAEVAVIDVGQGLAVAVRGPDGGLLLVDAGGSGTGRFDPGERVVVPYLRGWAGGRLEALIVTHDHADHAGGAFAVLEGLEVGELWLAPGSLGRPRLRRLADLAVERGTAVVLVEAGRGDRVAGLPVRILAPHRRGSALPSNDRSVVVRIGSEPLRLLIPGDLERAGERALLGSGAPLEAEALVLSHHGSRSGSAIEFLERVRPRWAIVSAGRGNPFGHPHPEVLERLGALGIPLLRTDRQGLIRLRSGPRGWLPTGSARRGGPERR